MRTMRPHPAQRPRREREDRVRQKFKFSLFYISAWFLANSGLANAFLCDHLPDNSWKSLVNAIESSFDGFVMLCPFEINGAKCPPAGETGHRLPSQSSLYLMCESVFSIGPPSLIGEAGGDETGTGCIIDCPGTHFEVDEYASLSLDSITLKGSLTSAIRVNNHGVLNAFNSFFQNNQNGHNGGAIYATEWSQIYLSQTSFTNNTSLNGGALYNSGHAQIHNSMFVGNHATARGVDEGGGAIYAGITSTTLLTDSYIAHNAAVSFGPAILDVSNGTFSAISNTGCNNTAEAFGIRCDGSLRVLNGVDVCATFETICQLPSLSPTVAQTTAPSSDPTIAASTAPSVAPTILPSLGPSVVPSTGPSDSPTLPPTWVPSAVPGSSSLPTTISPTVLSDSAITLGSYQMFAPTAKPNHHRHPLHGSSEVPASSEPLTMGPSELLEDVADWTMDSSVSYDATSSPTHGPLAPSSYLHTSTIALPPRPSSSDSSPPFESSFTFIPTATDTNIDERTWKPSVSEAISSSPSIVVTSTPTEASSKTLYDGATISEIPADNAFPSTLVPSYHSSFSPSEDMESSSQPHQDNLWIQAQATSSVTSHGFLGNQLSPPLVWDSCPPLNSPAPLLNRGAYLQGTTSNTGFDVGDLETCGIKNDIGDDGAWFSLVGNGGVMTAHTCAFFFESFQFDTQIEIYASNANDPYCMEGLRCVGENDDFCGQQSLVSWFARKGSVYYIYIRGESSTQATSIGLQHHFSLTLAPTPGGSCSTPISMDPHPITGELWLTGDPSGVDLLNLNGSIFYTVIGTGDWLMASTCQEDRQIPAHMSIFQGGCDESPNNAVVTIERNCGSGQFVTWLSEPGQSYFIQEYRIL